MSDFPNIQSLENDLEAQTRKVHQVTTTAEMRERELRKTNEDVSKCISLYCYVVVVVLIVALLLMILIVAVPGLITIQRKEVAISVVSILFVGIFVILFVVRRHPIMLLTIISLGLALGCFCLGLVTFGMTRLI